MGISELIKH